MPAILGALAKRAGSFLLKRSSSYAKNKGFSLLSNLFSNNKDKQDQSGAPAFEFLSPQSIFDNIALIAPFFGVAGIVGIILILFFLIIAGGITLVVPQLQ